MHLSMATTLMYDVLSRGCRLPALLLSVALVACGGGGSSEPAPTTAASTPTLKSIVVLPSEPTIAMGITQTFTATGEYSDGSTKALTTEVTWSSTGTASTIVAGTGMATGKAVGSDTITATVGTVKGTTKLTIKAPYSALAAGADHSLALRADGSLWAWGGNLFGQLGDGSLADKMEPLLVGSAKNWTAIATGEFHNLALRSDGSLWSWGYNLNGQLGDGTPGTNKSIPTRVGTLTTWAAVAAGKAHSVAIRKDGTLWAWGRNFYSQLGDGTAADRSAPVAVTPTAAPATKWSAVAAGASHTVGRDADGNLWAWGQNDAGQLGLGIEADTVASPRKLEGGPWVAIAAGQSHTLAIRADGALFSWGSNERGQLGEPGIQRSVPTRVGSDVNWSAIAAGDLHSVAIRTDGTVWAWGANSEGQLGDGTLIDRSLPTRIGDARDWVKVGAGNFHTLGLKADGSLWSWGRNASGQLGVGSLTRATSPSAVK
jgi:alpha-tubulin suppressor-like RCC1 family protein